MDSLEQGVATLTQPELDGIDEPPLVGTGLLDRGPGDRGNGGGLQPKYQLAPEEKNNFIPYIVGGLAALITIYITHEVHEAKDIQNISDYFILSPGVGLTIGYMTKKVMDYFG